MSTHTTLDDGVDRTFDFATRPRRRHKHARAVRAAWQRLRLRMAARSYRKAEADLQALSDRMLKDIGIDRSEIGSVVRDLNKERIRRHAASDH